MYILIVGEELYLPFDPLQVVLQFTHSKVKLSTLPYPCLILTSIPSLTDRSAMRSPFGSSIGDGSTFGSLSFARAVNVVSRLTRSICCIWRLSDTVILLGGISLL